MAEKLSPNDLALAAAQGVAIALNARKVKARTVGEELLYPVNHIICGMPEYLFRVAIEQGADGNFSAGAPEQFAGQ